MAIALNVHMLRWLAKTDGAGGKFIQANQHPNGGNCFVLTTPAGQKLAGAGGVYGGEIVLAKGLAKWRQLPKEERTALPPGEKVIPPELARCTPPPGGLILKSYIRNLKRDRQGELARITRADLNDHSRYPDWNPIYTEPAHYHVWLTEAEWKSLVPANPQRGDRFPVPEAIQKRLFRYHLLNGTFGGTDPWRLKDIRFGELMLFVEETSPRLRLQLKGTALLATDAKVANAERGYDARLRGWLDYDPKQQRFTRFDIVAIGDYWGGDYEGGRFKRPGRAPLGIAFELVQGDSVIDLIPPLLNMDRQQIYQRYFAAERGD